MVGSRLVAEARSRGHDVTGLDNGLFADCILGALDVPDVPGLTAAAVARLVALASPDALARAGYGGTPGHPVLIGREHRDRVLATLTGDSGAREYLRRHAVRAVECGDVADGRDVDTPDS